VRPRRFLCGMRVPAVLLDHPLTVPLTIETRIISMKDVGSVALKGTAKVRPVSKSASLTNVKEFVAFLPAPSRTIVLWVALGLAIVATCSCSRSLGSEPPETFPASTMLGPVLMQVDSSSLESQTTHLVQATFPYHKSSRTTGASNETPPSSTTVVVWHIVPRPGRHEQTLIRAELVKRGVLIKSAYVICEELDSVTTAEASGILVDLMARLGRESER
jgi:hypothetical protein